MKLKDLLSKDLNEIESKKLSQKEIDELLNELPNWGIDNENRLISNFEFKDFDSAVDFFNIVAKLANKVNHHPDLMLYQYNNLLVLLYTHDVDGITYKDFAFAARVEKLIESL